LKKIIIAFFIVFYTSTCFGGGYPLIELGGGVSISVPSPPGFRPLGKASEDFRLYSQSRLLPGSVLLEVFLTDKDFRDVLSGYSGSRVRELQIWDPAQVLGEHYDVTKFNQAVVDMRAMTDVSGNIDSAIREFLSSGVDSFSRTSPKKGNIEFRGKFMDEPRAVGILSCSVIAKPDGRQKYCVAQVVLHVRDRVVTLTIGSQIRGSADVDWVKSISLSWVDQIINAN